MKQPPVVYDSLTDRYSVECRRHGMKFDFQRPENAEAWAYGHMVLMHSKENVG